MQIRFTYTAHLLAVGLHSLCVYFKEPVVEMSSAGPLNL